MGGEPSEGMQGLLPAPKQLAGGGHPCLGIYMSGTGISKSMGKDNGAGRAAQLCVCWGEGTNTRNIWPKVLTAQGLQTKPCRFFLPVPAFILPACTHGNALR